MDLDLKQNTQIENIVFAEKNGEKLKFTARIIPVWISEQEGKTLIVLEDIIQSERFWEKMA